jgi:hypothetical protein
MPRPTPAAPSPVFAGFPDVSTPVLDDLTGRRTVSKQFIADRARSPLIRKAERDIITATLDELPESTVSVQEFAEQMKARLLPLETTLTPEPGAVDEGDFPNMYPSIALSRSIRGDVKNYYERIYRCAPGSTLK